MINFFHIVINYFPSSFFLIVKKIILYSEKEILSELNNDKQISMDLPRIWLNRLKEGFSLGSSPSYLICVLITRLSRLLELPWFLSSLKCLDLTEWLPDLKWKSSSFLESSSLLSWIALTELARVCCWRDRALREVPEVMS